MIEVTPAVFRGPHPRNAADLQAKGIKTSLNLETGIRDFLYAGDVYAEDEELEAAGIQVEHVAFSDWLPPTQAKLNEALHVLVRPDAEPVYVHCMHGVDRTGMVIAYYRVKAQDWSPERALQEMMDLGFHRFPYALTWLPRFKKILGAQ